MLQATTRLTSRLAGCRATARSCCSFFSRRWQSTGASSSPASNAATTAGAAAVATNAVKSQKSFLVTVSTVLVSAGVGAGGLWMYTQGKLPYQRGIPPSSSSSSAGSAAEEALTGEKSKRLSVFNKYATVFRDGKPYMSQDDFVNSLTAQESRNIPPHRLKAYLRLADVDNDGFVSFEDYCRFHTVLNDSLSEYQVAFRLFDSDNDQLISKDEFVKVMNASSIMSSAYDFDCEWLNLFFGADGTGKLSMEAFAQLLQGMGNERLKQEFMRMEQGDGQISPDQFRHLLRFMPNVVVPTAVRQRLDTLDASMLGSSEHGGVIGFASIVAFRHLMFTLPSAHRVLIAATHGGQRTVDPPAFRRVAVRETSVQFTPLEVKLLFALFGDGGRISLPHFEQMCGPRASAIAKVDASPWSTAALLSAAKDGSLNFMLGALAGGIGATVVYPIDLVKTRMQNQRNAGPGVQQLYRNSADCFMKVVRREGARGLYRGIGPQLVGVAPEKAIKLTVNDLLRSTFSGLNQGSIDFPLEVLAGAGAGASQVVFTNPLEIVKIRLQVAGESGAPRSAIQVVRELGFLGLYRGAAACLLRDIPFSAIYFPMYAKMKGVLSEEDGTVSPTTMLLAGTIAGCPAAGLTTPADVIKTRLQVDARAGQVTYLNIRHCASEILRTEGFSAFWKGAAARMLRSSPQFGVTLLSYELFQRYFFPELPPKPPTNAPVTAQDFTGFLNTPASRIQELEVKWGIIPPPIAREQANLNEDMSAYSQVLEDATD